MEHLGYSLAGAGIALVIALPLGLYIGHTGRGGRRRRARPTRCVRCRPSACFYLVVLGLPARCRRAWPTCFPVVLVLIVLGIPPILSNTYAGVEASIPTVARRGVRHGDDRLAGAAGGSSSRGAAADLLRAAQRDAAGDRHGDDRGVRLARRASATSSGRARQTSNYYEMAAGAVCVAVLAVALRPDPGRRAAAGRLPRPDRALCPTGPPHPRTGRGGCPVRRARGPARSGLTCPAGETGSSKPNESDRFTVNSDPHDRRDR